MGIVQCLFNLLYYVIGVRNTKKPPQHCMEGMGEGKLYFLLLKLVKHKKAPLGQSVSTSFVTDGVCYNTHPEESLSPKTSR